MKHSFGIGRRVDGKGKIKTDQQRAGVPFGGRACAYDMAGALCGALVQRPNRIYARTVPVGRSDQRGRRAGLRILFDSRAGREYWLCGISAGSSAGQALSQQGLSAQGLPGKRIFQQRDSRGM